MYRWDDTKGVVPRVATINTGEIVDIRYNVRSPLNANGFFDDLVCVISDSTGGNRVFRGQPNVINSQIQSASLSGSFRYFPNQNTEYFFRCESATNASDFGESLPPIVITVLGGITGFVCTGPALPLYTEIYPGDADYSVLAADTPWVFSDTNTPRMCEFHCVAGSVWTNSGNSDFTCSPPVVDRPLDPGPPPTVNFFANGFKFRLGETIRLTWDSTRADRCVKSGGGGVITWVTVGTSGSETFLPANGDGVNELGAYIYDISCTNEFGTSVNATVTVFVIDPAVINSLTATPDVIDSGQSSTLRWSVEKAVGGCRLYEEAVSNSLADALWWGDPTAITERVVSPTVTTDYVLSCLGSQRGGGSYQNDEETIRVTVNGSPDPDDPDIVVPVSNATCATPGASCEPGNFCQGDKQKVAACNGGIDSCCLAASTRTNVGDGQSSLITITNPLSFNTVEGLLNSILGFLQSIIAILSLIMIVIGALIYMTAAGDDKKLGTGKMIITAALVGLALALAAPSFLKQIGEILGWGPTDGSDVAGAKTILEILQTALNFLLSVVGIIAIIMLVIGGLMYLLSAGDEERMNTGKSIVIYSLIGIAVALSALVLVTQVARLFG